MFHLIIFFALFAGTVMASCYYASTPTGVSWFQTNQLEHELGDRAGDPVTFVCVTNDKDVTLKQQI